MKAKISRLKFVSFMLLLLLCNLCYSDQIQDTNNRMVKFALSRLHIGDTVYIYQPEYDDLTTDLETEKNKPIEKWYQKKIIKNITTKKTLSDQVPDLIVINGETCAIWDIYVSVQPAFVDLMNLIPGNRKFWGEEFPPTEIVYFDEASRHISPLIIFHGKIKNDPVILSCTYLNGKFVGCLRWINGRVDSIIFSGKVNADGKFGFISLEDKNIFLNGKIERKIISGNFVEKNKIYKIILFRSINRQNLYGSYLSLGTENLWLYLTMEDNGIWKLLFDERNGINEYQLEGEGYMNEVGNLMWEGDQIGNCWQTIYFVKGTNAIVKIKPINGCGISDNGPDNGNFIVGTYAKDITQTSEGY
jgi:hypothetical protein